MKIPQAAPKLEDIFGKEAESLQDIIPWLSKVGPVDSKGRYQHWDKIMHLEPPEGLNTNQWWGLIKMSRLQITQLLDFNDKNGFPFSYCVPNNFNEKLHKLDLQSAGNLQARESITNQQTRNTYLIKSLIEEAVSSSQLEGAATTRIVAKEMLRKGREPEDKSEQMILNNYHAMQFIRENKGEKLTSAMIFRLHKILTESTLDDSSKAGCFRDMNDEIHVYDETDQILHTPPNADDLPERLELLCRFANSEDSEDRFIHPVIRANILHFMLAYDHPFVDGNGRTARALFYWSMANQGYWLMEFISISNIIKQAQIKYFKAFLHTETDANDITYFLEYKLSVIIKAIEELHEYLDKKMSDIRDAEVLINENEKLRGLLGFRQLALIKHSLKNPGFLYNINEHKNSHGISYQTATTDLKGLAKLGFLLETKSGKTKFFISPQDLNSRIKKYGK